MNMRPDRFSHNILRISHSPIRKFFDLIIGNNDIISLGVGEPDFPTPWAMREEAFYHIKKGHTSYTSNYGLLSLRKEISNYLKKYNLHYSPEDEILITIGASEGVDIVLRSILNPGDEIIIAEPCYVSYIPTAEFCGAKVLHLDTSNNNFIPSAKDIEALITPKTKAIMLCSPSNPTGKIIPKSELEKIAELLKKYKIWCVSDEIYCELCYGSEEYSSIGSVEGMKEYTIVLNGFSKSFAMTGWRIGFMAAPKELISESLKLHQYGAICAPIMSQYAAIEGLRKCWSEVEKMRNSYQRRRNYMQQSFENMGIPIVPPDGAFYIFADIRKSGLSSEEFALRLIKEKKIAIVPGNAFGAGGEGFIRCCYATDIDKIKIAMQKIAEFIQEL